MNVAATIARAGESLPLPDGMLRAGIAGLVARTDRRLAAAPDGATRAFAAGMDAFPIALHTDAANEQHYEVPSAFFGLVLGPHRKYSCCLFDDGVTSLAEAEERALAVTAQNAGLADGQTILELGCGWGSLSLWMAQHYPAARIVSVSNSTSQRAHILAEAQRRGLTNLDVVTADMNDFSPPQGAGPFDRVVSVEMFEHMANWRALLSRAHGWVKPEGRLFLHVFSHRAAPYRFDHTDPADWIARHFFTGGIMPSHDLAGAFDDLFTVEADWRWSGEHYRRTAEAWLKNFDAQSAEIERIFARVYGRDAALWKRRWRLFFLATSGLFGHAGGTAWGVSHYRLAPRGAAV